MSTKEIMETLERTLRVSEQDATESEVVKPAVEFLLGDLLNFHKSVTERASSIEPSEALEAYSQAFGSLRTWAETELDRVRSRPVALRERQRTLESVINYVRSVDSRDSTDRETGT